MGCTKHLNMDSCIRRVPIFDGLTDEEVCSLHQVTISRTYSKGEYIFQEGEPSTTLYVLHKGMIKISMVSDEGKEQIIRIMFPGDFFGQNALLENKCHNAHAEVMEETVVCLIQKEDFSPILARNPNMALNFLMALSERLHMADEWIGNISLLEVEKRLAKALLLFYEKGNHGKDKAFQLPVTKKDFASLIGTSPETLSRKLVHFQSLNIIELKGRKSIQIVSPEKLKQAADC